MAEETDQEINLEIIPEQGFVSFVNSVQENKPDTTVYFFDRGDYYTVHGVDAQNIAKQVFKSTSVLKYIGADNNKLASVALSKLNFENLLRELLLVQRYRIEVFSNKGTTKTPKWEPSIKASPGDLLQVEEFLFGSNGMNCNSGVLAVKTESSAGQKLVAVSYLDMTSRVLSLCEIQDNEFFNNFESIVIQSGVRECLIPSGGTGTETNNDLKQLKFILERNNVCVTDKKRADFHSRDLVQDLNKLLKWRRDEQANAAALPEMKLKSAGECLGACIKYLEVMSDKSNYCQFQLTTLDLTGYMKLDNSAAQAVNIIMSGTLIDSETKFQSQKQSTIFSLLNKCRTTQGQRLLSRWIRQPLTDVNQINERLNIVDTFVDDSQLRYYLYEDFMARMPDFQRLARKFQKRKANLQDCYRVYQALEKLPSLLEAFEKNPNEHILTIRAVFMAPIQELAGDFAKFQAMIETTLDFQSLTFNEYMIKADFDESLQEIAEKLSSLEDSIQNCLDAVAKDLGLEANKTLKLESNQQIGYFFRVTRKDEKVLRGNKKYTTIETNKAGVRFHNEEIKKFNTQWLQEKSNYSEQQKAVVNEIINIAAGYSDPMLSLNDILAKLDVLLSFAMVSVTSVGSYVKPTVHEMGTGRIMVKQGRHPCVEGTGIQFIPNDIHFEKGDEMFHIITGPNMGGKSTYIRSVGVICLLAQIGCFVPCEEADITVVDAILARVGAGDCQMKGVSTFMAEMLETSYILRNATENSLIIIDELGRGTSTYDGFGLAWAISEHIAVNIGCFCLFATHFHELTSLAEVISTVNNLHVTALVENEKLLLLYKVKPGVCDQSFGIHVAELAKFPKDVIELAQQKADELEDVPVELVGSETYVLGDEKHARKLIVQQGEQAIADFIEKVHGFPLENMTDEEVSTLMEKMREEVKGFNNTYVNNIINRKTLVAAVAAGSLMHGDAEMEVEVTTSQEEGTATLDGVVSEQEQVVASQEEVVDSEEVVAIQEEVVNEFQDTAIKTEETAVEPMEQDAPAL